MNKEIERYKKIKQFNDLFFRSLFFLSGALAAVFIVLIFVFVFEKGISVFLPSYEGHLKLTDFLFGLRWDQSKGIYGVGFIIINTLITAFYAVVISFPLAILTALFIVKKAKGWTQAAMITVVELLAAIPSVVYGVFASGAIVLLVKNIATALGIPTFAGLSTLAVSLLLAIMIFPTMTSMAIVAIKAVPIQLEHGSLALGASQTQTNFKVVLTSAKSGIFAGLILGLGRAFGEATAVSMVAGNKMFGPSFSIFDITRTLTSTMLAGLKETTGLDYDVRFSVGIVLMIVILITNLLIHAMKDRIGKGEL